MRRRSLLFLITIVVAGAWGCAAGVPSGMPGFPSSKTSRTWSGKSGHVIRGTVAPATARAKGSLSETVVYVEPLQGTRALPKPENAPTAVVSTLHNQFVPGVLAITAGTTVEFRNRDRTYHNTFSVSPARRFDVGKYGPGKTRSVRFDQPGVVNLFCDLHPESAGFIIVLSNAAYTHADPSGAFTLPPLPAGSYVVHAWNPRLGETSRRVRLTAATDLAVNLRF